MKKLIMSALAASLTLSPIALSAAEAAPQHRQVTTTVHENRNGRTVVTRKTVTNRGYGYNNHRNWRRGERFDRRYAPSYTVLDYRRHRGLRQPPRGYHWVRSGNDAVLVGITSGIIASVIAGGIR